jgi:hypothetical protein
VLQFTGRQQWLSRGLFALLGGMGLLTLMFYCGPIRGTVSFFAGLRQRDRQHNFYGRSLVWTFVIYAYSLNLLAVLLLAQTVAAPANCFTGGS